MSAHSCRLMCNVPRIGIGDVRAVSAHVRAEFSQGAVFSNAFSRIKKIGCPGALPAHFNCFAASASTFLAVLHPQLLFTFSVARAVFLLYTCSFCLGLPWRKSLCQPPFAVGSAEPSSPEPTAASTVLPGFAVAAKVSRPCFNGSWGT